MSWIWYTLAVLWILDALRMRARLKAVPVLPTASGSDGSNLRFLRCDGVELSGETRAAALAFASKEGLELLDLIPANLPALQGLAFAQMVDPLTYRHNRVAIGHTSGCAVVVSNELLERAGENPSEVCEPEALAELVRKLRRFAGERADFAIAPTLSAAKNRLTTSWTMLVATAGGNAHGIFMLRAIMLVLLIAGLVFAPTAGLVALAAFHAQPLLAFAGLRLHPGDLFLTILLRTPIELWHWVETFRSRMRTARDRTNPIEARRPHYQRLLAKGISHFWEPRRSHCPLCGSEDLKVRIRNIDLIQRKPGVFTLEQCQSCRHTFQNPRLNSEGLSFYYGDFYDGLGGSVAETMFRARPGLYINRAKVVEGLRKPSHWLDVGTGQAHFCSAARSHWKETEFDGLDISDGIDDAVRAGWINRGYHGFFSELAPQLAGQYDVVSLFHCLEHTPDPRREISAAHTTLVKEGLLVIENPNPECVFGKIFGRFWLPWFQPQHLHMPTVANLDRLLKEEGFTTVRVQYGEAHLPIDFFSATMLFFGWIAPKANLAWRPRPTRFAKARQFLVWNLGFPFLILAMLTDSIAGPICRRLGISNAFRIVALRGEKPAKQTLTSGAGDTVNAASTMTASSL